MNDIADIAFHRSSVGFANFAFHRRLAGLPASLSIAFTRRYRFSRSSRHFSGLLDVVMRSCSNDKDVLLVFVDSVKDTVSVGQANGEVASEVAYQVFSAVRFGCQSVLHDVFELGSDFWCEFFDVFERSLREEDPITSLVNHP